MAKHNTRQHIVPQSYLKRFASQSSKSRYSIGVKYLKSVATINSVDKVAFKNNAYDVSIRDDKKYWEKFFANKIEPLYGACLTNIISKITLASNQAEKILDEFDKMNLAKMIFFQLIRLPSFLDRRLVYGSEVTQEILHEINNIFEELSEAEKNQVKVIKENQNDYIKDIILGLISDFDWIEKYLPLLTQKIWIIYTNHTSTPFITSDNPVAMYNFELKSLTSNKNGLGRKDNVIFYPISSRILLQLIPNNLFWLKGLDVSKIKLKNKDIEFINIVNSLQIKRADQQFYFSPEYLKEIKKLERNL